MNRKSGILMPIFSLPNAYGIGSFGKESYRFIDFLEKAGQKIWQILPLVQTGLGNSPYSSVSINSFNPFFISLEKLKKEKLITPSELKSAKFEGKYIDYGFVFNTRTNLLRLAFERFDIQTKSFVNFRRSKKYFDYAMFMAIKEKNNNKAFYDWENGLKFRDKKALADFYKNNKNLVIYYQFLQYLAQKQWFELKKYANSKGISIMGDMPLYVALDSVDVWCNPKLFKLNADFTPVKVAGVPPDYFSKTGQLWGNPVFDYDMHKKDDFNWWIKRLQTALSTFDYVRIDHFRGLDRFYEIPYGCPDATCGEWADVPSKELFDKIHKSISKKRIIAEDLGILDDGVYKLLEYTGYPGMKILSFAFNGESDNFYLPENLTENSVCYTGTHDNDTLKGLIDNSSEWDYNNIVNGVKISLKKLGMKKQFNNVNSLINVIIHLGLNGRSNWFIMPMQDLFKKGTDYRINQPGIVNKQNWAVKFSSKDFTSKKAESLKKLTEKYNRI